MSLHQNVTRLLAINIQMLINKDVKLSSHRTKSKVFHKFHQKRTATAYVN